MKARILGPTDDRQPDFFEKVTNFYAATLLYQSLLERKSFMNLKETQLFYLVIKLTKPVAVLKACMYEMKNRKVSVS